MQDKVIRTIFVLIILFIKRFKNGGLYIRQRKLLNCKIKQCQKLRKVFASRHHTKSRRQTHNMKVLALMYFPFYNKRRSYERTVWVYVDIFEQNTPLWNERTG